MNDSTQGATLHEGRTFRLPLVKRARRGDLDLLLRDLCDQTSARGVNEIHHTSIHFDLSQARFMDLDLSLWLVVVIGALRSNNNYVRLTLPSTASASDSNVWSFLIRWRFFNALSRHADLPENLLDDHQVRHVFEEPKYLQRVGVDESGKRALLFTERLLAIADLTVDPDLPVDDQIDAFLSRYRDLILLRALALACGLESEDAQNLLSFIAEEGVQNSLAHAGGTFSMVAMQVIDQELADIAEQDPVLVIAVCDDGLGIPEVLRRAKQDGEISREDLPEDDAELIKLFASLDVVRDSVILDASTRRGLRSSRGRPGMGLYFLRDYVDQLGGRLTIRSGSAAVQFRAAEDPREWDGISLSPGTLLKVEIPLAP